MYVCDVYIYIYMHVLYIPEIRSFLKELKGLEMKYLKSSFTKLPFSVIFILKKSKLITIFSQINLDEI